MRPEIISEKSITISEARADLARIKAREGELSFRSTKTEEYLNQFATLEEKKARDIQKKVEALNIPRIKESHICKIIDVMPANLIDLKAALQGYTLTIKDENLKKILEIIEKESKPNL